MQNNSTAGIGSYYCLEGLKQKLVDLTHTPLLSYQWLTEIIAWQANLERTTHWNSGEDKHVITIILR